MILLLIALIIGILIGAALFCAVPAGVWLIIAMLFLVGTMATRSRTALNALVFLCIAAIGIQRTTIDIEHVAAELEEVDAGFSQSFQSRAAGSIAQSFTELHEKLMLGLQQSGLDDETLAVASAMSLGDKRYITKDLRDTYSRTGASHILALSGMHMAIVFALIYLIIAWLPLRIALLPLHVLESRPLKGRKLSIAIFFLKHSPKVINVQRVAWTIALATIWAYALLVGASASVIRSAIMITIVILHLMTKRVANMKDSLILAAFIMLLVNPLMLFDVGFQLSFGALTGILLYTRYFNELFLHMLPVFDLRGRKYKPRLKRLYKTRWYLPLRRVVLGIWSCFAISIAAQIITLPLVVHYFGTLSLIGPFTSIVVSLGGTLIVWLSLALIALATIGIPTGICAWVVSKVVLIQNGILRFADTIPYSSITDIRLSIAQVLLLYSVIALATYLLYKVRRI